MYHGIQLSIDVCRSEILIILIERTSDLTDEICEFFFNQPCARSISIIRLPLLTVAYRLLSLWLKCIRKIPVLEWKGVRATARDR